MGLLFGWATSSITLDFFLSSILSIVALILGALYIFQCRLIYIPQFPPGSLDSVWNPSEFAMPVYEDVTLTASDGCLLHAYWIPSTSTDVSSAPTVLYFHANAGNMGHRLPVVRSMVKILDGNVNIFMLSYRGYGKSKGRPHEKGIRLDSQAAFDYVWEKAENGEIDPSKIVVYGQSIGGAVAIDVAARNIRNVAAIMVENTFTSLPNLVPHVMPLLGWATILMHQKWKSIERLHEIRRYLLEHQDKKLNVLFLSGLQDELIPPMHMQTLHRVFLSDNLDDADHFQLVAFEKGTHNDTCLQPGYYQAIKSFLQKSLLI